jgi:phage shock protein A
MKYKYTTTFEAEVSACRIGESLISLASLDTLRPLVPDKIDFSENIDLMGVAFNAAVVNRFNKNGDGIDSATASKFSKNFLHKPTNIEHDKEKIVGHIASYGFSEYGTNKILSEEEIANYKQPFNISLGAVVYKTINQSFAEALERSVDPTNGLYQKISTSWEVGFTDYVLALGSDDVNEAEIISDKNHIQELKGFLKAYGGNGRTKDGQIIHRLIVGNIFPLGIGYTINPAADVKGIFMPSSNDSPVKIIDKRDKKISQNSHMDVKSKKNNSMDIEQIISELKGLLIEKKFSEEAVASMTSTFADAIHKKDEEYRAQLAETQAQKESLAKEREELKAALESLETKVAESSTKIAEFEAVQKAEEAIARFNARMDALDQQFDLEDEDRQFLAQELTALDHAEEAFASFQTKLGVLWKHKNKETKAVLLQEMEAKIQAEVDKRINNVSQASVVSESQSTENILDQAKATDSALPTSSEDLSREEVSLRDKFAAAFDRKNIVIS